MILTTTQWVVVGFGVVFLAGLFILYLIFPPPPDDVDIR